jgi:hypothetical protein
MIPEIAERSCILVRVPRSMQMIERFAKILSLFSAEGSEILSNLSALDREKACLREEEAWKHLRKRIGEKSDAHAPENETHKAGNTATSPPPWESAKEQ